MQVGDSRLCCGLLGYAELPPVREYGTVKQKAQVIQAAVFRVCLYKLESFQKKDSEVCSELAATARTPSEPFVDPLQTLNTAGGVLCFSKWDRQNYIRKCCSFTFFPSIQRALKLAFHWT